jgi:hypothetical protein
MPTQHTMGGASVSANVAAINFEDGTTQNTAAQNTDPLNGVVVSPTPPTIGQVITATSPTTADWATPSSGGPVTKTTRVDMGTIASATPSLVTSYTWPTPFADNNYTIAGSVVILETPPAGAATAIVCIGSIELQDGGVGINFVVCNADGVPHHVVAQFIAIHD